MSFIKIVVILLMLSLSSNGAIAKTKIRLSGSSTVYNSLFIGNGTDLIQEDVIEASPSSSGHGMIDLIEGRNDIAMISADLETILNKLNHVYTLNEKTDQYDIHYIAQTKVLFVVHPENTINTITRQQAIALLSGEITTWNHFGGYDNMVKVVTEPKTGGVYNTVLSTVMNKTPITENRIKLQNGSQTAIVVSQLKGGIGILSATTPNEQLQKVKVLNTDSFSTVQKMYLITKKGALTDNVAKIIKIIQKRATSE